MLPLILGSIALTAVGFGVKEYCEAEGCPSEREPAIETSQKIFARLQTLKQETAIGICDRAVQVLSRIEGLEGLPAVPAPGADSFPSSLTPEQREQIEAFRVALSRAVSGLNGGIEDVESMLEVSTVYDAFSPEARARVDEVRSRLRSLCKVVSRPTVDAEGDLTTKAKKWVKKSQGDMDAALVSPIWVRG